MNEADYEEIDLVFRFTDLDEPRDETDNPDDDDDPCTGRLTVTRIGEDWFQVYEPVSLTPFGPFGPFLGLGTRIRAKKMPGGAYRLASIQEGPKVWTWRFHSPEDSLMKDDVKAALEDLSEKGCRWEFCAGNFTIQRYREPDETSPPASLIETISSLLGQTISPK